MMMVVMIVIMMVMIVMVMIVMVVIMVVVVMIVMIVVVVIVVIVASVVPVPIVVNVASATRSSQRHTLTAGQRIRLPLPRTTNPRTSLTNSTRWTSKTNTIPYINKV